MPDAEAATVEDVDGTVKATKRITRRSASTSKQSPASKKSKTATTTPNTKAENDTIKKSITDDDEMEVTRELSEESADNASPSKISLEEKRKVIQAERLRKQREMEALMEEEEALLAAEHDEETTADSVNGLEAVNQSADSSYDTRSEVEESHEDDDGKQDSRDEFESMDDAPGDEELNQLNDEQLLHDQSAVEESHEPPVEGGLAGLDDEEDESDNEPTDEKKRAISPVTWDVDVHAHDETISDDSPLVSDESDGGVGSDDEDKNGKRIKSVAKQDNGEKRSIKVSNHIKVNERSEDRARSRSAERPSSDEKNKAIEEAEALRPRVHKYLYREAKYFMVKSSNHENVRLAKAKGVWSTPPQNESRFNRAVEENTTVILIFSVKESGSFQGFARINGVSQKDGPRINWVLPPGISAKALSGVFKLDWISRTDLSFTKTTQLRNPFNQHKPVKIARDGQEVEPHVGESLCKTFVLDGSSDYERVISRVKRKREALQAKGPIAASKPPYRPSPPPGSRGGYAGEHRGEARGYGSGRGGYRGGNDDGYRPAPPPSYSSRHASASHHGYGSEPPSQYYTSSSRSAYHPDYRSRGNYPPGHLSYQQPAPYHPSPVSQDIFVKGSYEQYVSQMRRYAPDISGSMAMYDPYSASYHAGGRDAPPPPPIPSYSTSRNRDRDRGRPSPDRYDRAVEDFLRRTSSGRPRGDHRYKDARDPRDGRDPRVGRDPRDIRDYHRGRSRSRERDRHRERR